jgi:hypothetical protein
MRRHPRAWLLLLAFGCNATAPPGEPDPPDPDPPGEALREGFEAGLNGWERDFELPLDPNRPGEVVEWSIETHAGQAAEGASSARFLVDGRQDDGTIWLVKSFAADPAATYDVDLSLQLWSENESFNTRAAVAAYAGPLPPGTESDFDLTQPTDLAAGWKTYTYPMRALSDAQGRIWIAFGITVLWETEIEHYFDDIRIDLRLVTE